MIMITTFDPFGEAGTKGGTETIKQLLSYLKNSKMENVKDKSTSQIHNYVTTVKQSAKVRNRFMTLGEWLDQMKE